LYSVLPQARGLRRQSSSWCTWLSHVPTPTPHPPLPEASGVRWGLPYLLPTPLHILQAASRVHNEGRKQNAVGGVLLNAPSPLWGSPIFLQGNSRLTWSPMHDHPRKEAWVLCVSKRPPHRLDGLTSQARYVRGHFSRRAMHASGDSPWHSSAKHHILEACFCRMTPFRSRLLPLQSGLQRLTPRAQSVPAYAQVLRHSSIALSRRTRIEW
jgi:hypothetical protein